MVSSEEEKQMTMNKLMFIILLPLCLFAQFGLTDIERLSIIPEDIAGTIYCKSIFKNDQLTEFEGYKVIGQLSVNIVVYNNVLMPCLKIITGRHDIEDKTYIYIETPKYIFLIDDAVDENGLRFMQVIYGNRSTKYFVKIR